jgi:hypothetical protein
MIPTRAVNKQQNFRVEGKEIRNPIVTTVIGVYNSKGSYCIHKEQGNKRTSAAQSHTIRNKIVTERTMNNSERLLGHELMNTREQ